MSSAERQRRASLWGSRGITKMLRLLRYLQRRANDLEPGNPSRHEVRALTTSFPNLDSGHRLCSLLRYHHVRTEP